VFAAYDDGSSVTHMRQVEGTSLLVTVGEEGGEAPPVLKVWALDKLVKKTGVPTCLSVVVVNNGKKPFPVGYGTLTAWAGVVLTGVDLGVYGYRGPVAGRGWFCEWRGDGHSWRSDTRSGHEATHHLRIGRAGHGRRVARRCRLDDAVHCDDGEDTQDGGVGEGSRPAA